MDQRGYWHDAGKPDRITEMMTGSVPAEDAPRFIIELQLGSTVEIRRGDETMLGVLESIVKNKVTIRPLDETGKARMYLDLAETVILSDGSVPGVKAQVWDNRDGKIILRTLPVN